jgi:hypothetical protein
MRAAPASFPRHAPTKKAPATKAAKTTKPTKAAKPAAEKAPKAEKQPKPAKEPKAPREPKAKKPSAIDAAMKVLGEVGAPMNSQGLIKAMADKGYWTSPGGQTPHATHQSTAIESLL